MSRFYLDVRGFVRLGSKVSCGVESGIQRSGSG